MKTQTKLQLYIFFAALCVPFYAYSYPGESIIFNPASGDYTITYWNESADPQGLETTIFIPATKIEPTIQSRFSAQFNGAVVYRYTMSNGSKGKQDIVNMIFDLTTTIIGTQNDRHMGMSTPTESVARMAVLKTNQAALSTPIGWHGSVAFGLNGDNSVRIAWMDLSKNFSKSIKPGNKWGGFGYSSFALPGIGEVQIEGDAPVQGWSGEGPTQNSAIIQKLDEIEQNNFVPRNAAVPTIAMPVPYDPAVLLDRIRTQVATWPAKQLLDSAFAAQLDRTMVAAANAFRNNQPKAGREHIESLRRLLDHEHKYLDHDDEDNDDTPEHKAATRLTIDRLAARVLDFDLRYVLKRMEKEHEHDHDEGDRRKEQERR